MMVLLNIYTRNIKIKYKSTLISKASFLMFVSELFTVIFSFMIAYNTGGFWLKKVTYYEQPKITVLGDYILIAKTNNASNPIVCSTYPFYKNYLEQFDLCSIVKLREVDHNFDGKNDETIFEISLNLYNFTLNSIYFVLPIRYQLSEPCPLRMQSLIFYEHNFQQEKVTELQLYAHLNFFQSSAISCKNKYSENYNVPIIENGQESRNFAPESIVTKYLERSISTHLMNVYTIIKTENKKTFSFKLLIRYPEHKIYYIPGFWQIIKSAWIQYFAIYIILSWLIRQIRKYIFDNRLVWYYKEFPLNKR